MARPRRRFGIIAAASVATSFPVPAHAAPASAASAGDAVRWQSFIDEAASRFSVPASWIRAVIRIESNGNPKALSPKGAVGLMQLMPDTYAESRVRYRLGDDPKDPHDNIIAGTAYLRDMHERFGQKGFIAAYNAGPQRYEDHLATGRPLPDETLAYVAKLAPLLSNRPLVDNSAATTNYASWQRSPLFVKEPSDISGARHSAFAPHAMFLRDDQTVADLSALVLPPGRLFANKPKPWSK
jgi:soluble lytic murein transglycosylase-like protein